MAVEFGDHASGFRHNEVIRFINNEVLMNGGGPEFYMAFRSRSWNEVEDRLRTVVVDPQVPRALKRACTWSALALGVRVMARQREQQGRRTRRLEDQVEEREAACWALASELQRLREERDELVTQLLFTQSALQQATNECDMLRGRLFQIEGVAQVVPLAHDVVPGLRTDQLGAAAWPLNGEHQRNMGATGGNDRLYFETRAPAPTTVLYMPGPPNHWAPPMQPPLQVPVPYPVQFQPPVPVGYPYLPPPPPPVVMEAEAGVVPLQMPPVGMYPPGPWAGEGFQEEMAPLWNQNCYVQAEAPGNLQGSMVGYNRSLSQQQGTERPQGIPPLVNMGNTTQEGHPMRQGFLPMVSTGNRNGEKGPQRLHRVPPPGDSVCSSQEEDQEQSQGLAPLVDRRGHIQEEGPEIPQGMVSQEDRGTSSQDEGPEGPQRRVPLVDGRHQGQEERPQMPQGIHLFEESGHYSQEDDQERPEGMAFLQCSRSQNLEEGPEGARGMEPLSFSGSHSQEEKPERTQGITPPGFRRSHSLEEDSEGPQEIPTWGSWSQAVRESPKKQQPQRQKARQLEGRRAMGSQYQEKSASSYSQDNWICQSCKAMNFSWRTACYKCKKTWVPVDGDTGQAR